ncbi:hypothetical protein D3C84_808430 [compost metagenome]
MLAVITAGEQIAAQSVGKQQMIEGTDTEVGACVGRVDFHESLLLTVQAQQQTLFAADVKGARMLRQPIQVHAPVIVTALDPRLPVLAVVSAVQQQAKGSHGKTAALVIEHHIQKGCGQYARGRRGTGGRCDFLEHQGCGLVAFFCPRAVIAIEQRQQAAPIELHLPVATPIGGVQYQSVVTDDPAIALIAKPDLYQIAGNRTVDLLPGFSRIR